MIKCGRPRKGEELLSRDRLLDTAFSLFLEYGYGNLSLETIARDARVSMRTIYSQFGGKAGLFGAVIRRCSDQFVTSLSEEYVLESLSGGSADLLLPSSFCTASRGRTWCAYVPYSSANRYAFPISPPNFMNKGRNVPSIISRSFSPGSSKRAILPKWIRIFSPNNS